jgi:hypothetical protein
LKTPVVQVVRFSPFFSVKRCAKGCTWKEKSFEMCEFCGFSTEKVFQNSEKTFPRAYFFIRNLVKKREWEGLWRGKLQEKDARENAEEERLVGVERRFS